MEPVLTTHDAVGTIFTSSVIKVVWEKRDVVERVLTARNVVGTISTSSLIKVVWEKKRDVVEPVLTHDGDAVGLHPKLSCCRAFTLVAAHPPEKFLPFSFGGR